MMRASTHTSPRPTNFASLSKPNSKNIRVHRSGSITISASPLNVDQGDDSNGWGRPDLPEVPMSPSLLDLASGPLY